jgi:hypothetical protein
VLGAAAAAGALAGCAGGAAADPGSTIPSLVRVSRATGASMRMSPKPARTVGAAPSGASAPLIETSVAGTAIDLAAKENSFPSPRCACGCVSDSVATACSGAPVSLGGAPTVTPGSVSSLNCSPIACASAASCLPPAIATLGSPRSSCAAMRAGGAALTSLPGGTAVSAACDTARLIVCAWAARSAPLSATRGSLRSSRATA